MILDTMGFVGCVVGATVMWLPCKRAGVNRDLAQATRNSDWMKDAEDLHWLAGGGALMFCAIGGLFATRIAGL